MPHGRHWKFFVAGCDESWSGEDFSALNSQIKCFIETAAPVP